MQLYKQQEEALEAMKQFIESEDSVFILKGYAGTGKTTMIKALCGLLDNYKKTYKLMAPTGRAAKVLGEKTGIDATTIHKAIYNRSDTMVSYHDDSSDSKVSVSISEIKSNIADINIYFSLKKITDNSAARSSVIIVDEASLISSRPSSQEIIQFGTGVLMADLLTFSQLTLGTKIVFVGDPAQLPPVGDNQSCALSETYFLSQEIRVRSFILTDVVRQKKDSFILTNAMRVRNLLNSTLRNKLHFDLRIGEVESISAIEVIDKYTKIYPTPMLNQSVVICYSNTQTQDYNRAIRQRYYTEDALQNGDVLQVVRNNYNIIMDEGTLLNGDFIRVISKPSMVEVLNIPVWVDREGKPKQEHIELRFQNIDFETDRGTTGSAKILTTLLETNRAALTRDESVALYIYFVIRHSNLAKHSDEFVLALIKDPYLNALQAKYGYAITGHKSQGGEWETVFVDYAGRTGLDNDSLRWNYTATTRAAECLFGINIPHITPFNKFDISPIQTVSKSHADVISLRDLKCSTLDLGATPAQKAKYYSIEAALDELGCKVLSVTSKPYRDRYTIKGSFGEKEYDCQYNGAGLYTKYSSLRHTDEDIVILEALHDERYYEYEYDYTPSMECLENLRGFVASATDEIGIKVTGIKEYTNQYYVLYGLKTFAPFATLQFYFNKKGFITRAIAASAMGPSDELLNKLVTRIQELTCLQ